MVARDIPPTDPLEHVSRWLAASVMRLMRWWQRILTKLHARLRRASATTRAGFGAWSNQWAVVWEYIRRPASAWEGHAATGVPGSARTAAAAGARALAAGGLLAGALAMTGGDTARGATAALAVQVAWALGRLAVCRTLVPAGTLPPKRVTAVCMAAWLPYALALTGPLRFVAFVWSASLTYRGLVAAGLEPQRARTAVLWAFGGQVGVMAVAALTALTLLALGGA